MIYGLDGSVLSPGTGPVAQIPITLLGHTPEDVRLTDVILSDRQGRSIPVNIRSGAIKATSLPDVFTLESNTPNPFNPSTSIAYEVPQQAHIQLVVYNLLGQEVIRLVDQVQSAGRYEVIWNARNGQGAPVASGIYMYRLTSSTGYSESKRMTLLK